ncbi:MAG: NADH-quinone oxidoreductase subunit NuoE [Acidobacteriaceae bacterium]
MNALQEKYPDQIKAILAKYPSDRAGKRSAVMPLLYLAQRENGYVTKEVIGQIAEICEISTTDVSSLIGFYTLFHEEGSSRYQLQVCTDLPCALRGAEAFLQNLCENLGIKVGETTPDGKIAIESVMCLAGCHHAPLFQVQSPDGISYHEDQTVESALEVINKLRGG